MKGPCYHNTLTVCDPNTVEMTDLVPSGMVGFTKSGLQTSQLALKWNEKHQWYYYPHMTNNEVLLFK